MMADDNLSDYERIRLANIERNNAFLQSIGLGYSFIKRNNEFSTGEERLLKKSKAKVIKNINYDSIPSEFTRRSLRIATLNTPSYFDPSYEEKDLDKTSSSTSKHRKGENGAFIETNNPYQYLLSNSNTTSTCSVIDGNSTRNLNANYTQFITPINLSKPNEVFGKAAVVTQSNNGQIPKFSKYSGILEWKNCVYLWVNLELKTAENTNNKTITYNNTFLDEGRSFVWFGGSKMTKESPITQRLLRVGLSSESESQSLKNSSESDSKTLTKSSETDSQSLAQSTAKDINKGSNINDNEEEAILLFVRIVGEPYCCLGKVTVLNCNFDRNPIVIHWKLTQYTELKNGVNSHLFKRLLQSSLK